MENLDRYRPRLRHVARRIVDDAEADDLVQETLLRALVSPPPDPDAPVLPWLSVVARRLAIDVVRERGSSQLRFEPEPEAAEPTTRSGLAELLPGLGGLSDPEVAVLVLREALELDIDTVAEALDISPGSVRGVHHRARRKAAAGSDPAAGLEAIDRFCTWLLARYVAGLPVTPGPGSVPALAEGVVRSHRLLLDAVVEAAHASGRRDLVARALTSRGIAGSLLREPSASEDLRAAVDAGAPADHVAPHLVRALSDAGHAAEAQSWLARGLEVCTRPPRRRLLHSLGLQLALDAGDAAAARSHHDALAGVGVDSPGAQAMRHMGDAYRATAEERWPEARAAWWSAWGLARELGNPANELALLNNLVLACLSDGRLDEAEEHLAFARELLLRARLPSERSLELDGNGATLLLLRGRAAAATVAFERLVPAFTLTGQALHAALARYHLGVLAHLGGEAERAVRLLDSAVEPLVSGGAGGLAIGVEVQREAARLALGRSKPGALERLRERALAANRPSTARAAGIYAASAAGHDLDQTPDRTPIVVFARWLSANGMGPDPG